MLLLLPLIVNSMAATPDSTDSNASAAATAVATNVNATAMRNITVTTRGPTITHHRPPKTIFTRTQTTGKRPSAMSTCRRARACSVYIFYIRTCIQIIYYTVLLLLISYYYPNYYLMCYNLKLQKFKKWLIILENFCWNKKKWGLRTRTLDPGTFSGRGPGPLASNFFPVKSATGSHCIKHQCQLSAFILRGYHIHLTMDN